MSQLNLNTKQRKFLKQLCHPLKPLMHIGKEGVSSSFIEELTEQLEHHELLKIRVLNNCSWEKEQIVSALEAADIAIVQRVGHVLTVYRESEENPQIKLPG